MGKFKNFIVEADESTELYQDILQLIDELSDEEIDSLAAIIYDEFYEGGDEAIEGDGEFSFSKEFYQIFILQFLLAIGCFLIMKWVPKPTSYLAGSSLIVLSAIHAYWELNKRLDIKSVIDSIIKKNK